VATGRTPRACAERFSHSFVIRRRLPPPFQRTRIYVSSEAGLKYLGPSLADVDPVLIGLAEENIRPGAVVWDVGANVGLFTFAAATAAGATGRVLAIEPDTWLVHLLRRSVGIAPDHVRVDVLPVAIGAASGVSTFCIAVRNRSTNHLDGFGHQTGGVRSVQLVPTMTLDDLLAHFAPPDVLKIDVEGAESLVLRGGEHLLGETRPTVICEVAKESSATVTDLLVRHGYRIFDGQVPPAARTPLASAPWTTLAVPAESDEPGSRHRTASSAGAADPSLAG
jgi:FkbM family methyltransferase